MLNKRLTLPNWQYQPYTATEIAALVDLAPETLVFIAYNSDYDVIHLNQILAFLAQYPTPRVIVRVFETNIGQFDPSVWANICRDVCLTRLGYIKQLECIPWNEPNIEWTDHQTDWAYQANFAATFAAQWRQIAPDVPLHLPALSPTGNYWQGWEAYAAAGLYDMFEDRKSVG